METTTIRQTVKLKTGERIFYAPAQAELVDLRPLANQGFEVDLEFVPKNPLVGYEVAGVEAGSPAPAPGARRIKTGRFDPARSDTPLLDFYFRETDQKPPQKNISKGG
jgi:hypothetical protein